MLKNVKIWLSHLWEYLGIFHRIFFLLTGPYGCLVSIPDNMYPKFACLTKRTTWSNFLIRTPFWVKRVVLGLYHQDGRGRLGFEWFRALLFLSKFLPLIQILIMKAWFLQHTIEHFTNIYHSDFPRGNIIFYHSFVCTNATCIGTCTSGGRNMCRRSGWDIVRLCSLFHLCRGYCDWFFPRSFARSRN